MKESILKEYFENKISSELLSADLTGGLKQMTSDTSQISIERMECDSEFEIERAHIDKILTDTLKGKLTPDNLKTMVSALMFSDYFTWHPKTENGNRVETILVEIDNTEINFSITRENLQLWKEYLESGIHKLQRK